MHAHHIAASCWQGGTHITISGTGLRLGSQRHCRFGAAYEEAAALFGSTSSLTAASIGPGESSLVCLAPPLLSSAHAQASVSLSIAGGGSEPVGNFSYYPVPAVTHIFPASGSELGGVKVRVYGENLGAVSALVPACSFGGVDVLAAVDGLLLDEIVCVSPSMNTKNHLEAVILRVTLNGHDYTNQAALVERV